MARVGNSPATHLTQGLTGSGRLKNDVPSNANYPRLFFQATNSKQIEFESASGLIVLQGSGCNKLRHRQQIAQPVAEFWRAPEHLASTAQRLRHGFAVRGRCDSSSFPCNSLSDKGRADIPAIFRFINDFRVMSPCPRLSASKTLNDHTTSKCNSACRRWQRSPRVIVQRG